MVEKLSPENRSRDEIIQEYDANFGFPQAELVQNIKSLVKESKSIDTYSDWFKVGIFFLGQKSCVLSYPNLP